MRSVYIRRRRINKQKFKVLVRLSPDFIMQRKRETLSGPSFVGKKCANTLGIGFSLCGTNSAHPLGRSGGEKMNKLPKRLLGEEPNPHTKT
ncbi:hypothetical protein Trydic_g19578 [Trypoxylus dichotomus]